MLCVIQLASRHDITGTQVCGRTQPSHSPHAAVASFAVSLEFVSFFLFPQC